MTTERTRQNLFGIGPVVLGLLLLSGALIATVLKVTDGPPECRAPTSLMAASGDGPKSMIAVEERSFRLGGGLCIGINLPRYFAVARAAPRVDSSPRLQSVQIFFDEYPTPATITFDIDSAGNGGAADRPWTGWSWQRVTLRPAAMADTEAGKRWRILLTSGNPGASRRVFIGVGDKLSTADASLPKSGAVTARAIRLRIFEPVLALLGGSGLLLVVLGTARLSWGAGLLRDTSAGKLENAPFSLARVQMAFWLLLSIVGFLAVWLITGVFSGIITSGLLTLLGISASSGLAARLIDADGPARPAAGSRGFWLDLLSENHGDGQSIALHRLQMVAWTIILGLVFLWSVLTSFSLPDFDTNLLLLLGISGGTYIGFKFPEGRKATAASASPNPPSNQGE